MLSYRAFIVSLLVAGLVIETGLAGDLNPPVGPVAPTMKTLQEVEPRTPVQWQGGSATATYYIDAPGSYYLIDNITAETGKHAIEIDADNVTLDLRGFVLDGAGGAGTSGVFVVGGIISRKDARGAGPSLRHSIAVYNGSVEGWGSAGIDLTNASNSRVERIRAYYCFGDGIAVYANSAVVDCLAEANFNAGIRGVDLCVFRGCTASFNYNGGLRGGTAATISGCVAEANTYGGLFAGAASSIANCASRNNLGIPAARGGGSGSGYEVEDNCTLANCSADFNQNDGFIAIGGCTFTNCSSRSNLGSGYNVTDDVHISHSTATQNGFIGMWVNGGTIANSTSNRNGGAGISSFFQPLSITHCTTSFNGADGIYLDYGGRIEGCTASQNGDDGIEVTDNSVVVNNKCSGNGTSVPSAGIHATSVGNRIEGNQVADQERGVDVDSAGNLVIRNSAKNHIATHYDISGGNTVGPIVDSSNIATDSNPHANYEF